MLEEEDNESYEEAQQVYHSGIHQAGPQDGTIRLYPDQRHHDGVLTNQQAENLGGDAHGIDVEKQQFES